MKQPIVSVIMPVYNGEAYLRQCIDSVINQTLKDIEIICVDDGSTDGSCAILDEYARKDARIIVLKQKNGGAGTARNNGLRVAKGKYLSFLDSDDFFEPEMLELASAKLSADNADFVVYRCDQFLNDSQEYKKVKYTLKDETLPPYTPFNYQQIRGNIFKTFVGWAWDKLYDAEFVKRHNLTFQEQRTSNDMRFVFTALFLAKRITWIDNILVHQRRNNGSSLSNTREKSWFCFYDALIALRQNLISANKFWELEKDYINYALHFSLWNLNTITGECYYKLYNKLKEEWFAELGVADKTASYFYNYNEYRQLKEIMTYSADEFRCKLSVIVLADNNVSNMASTVNSIFSNNDICKECVCVGPLPSEQVMEIISSKKQEGCIIDFIEAENNCSVMERYKLGIEYSHGQYVHLIQSGDFVYSKEYSRIWTNSDKLGLDFTKAVAEIDGADETVKELLAFEHFNKGFDDRLIDKRFPEKMKNISPVIWNAVYRKSMIKRNIDALELGETVLFTELFQAANNIVVTRRKLIRRIVK